MTLRLRLLLIIGVSLTALWTLVAAWMWVDARQSLRDALDNRLAASARMVAGLVSQFPEPQDLATAEIQPLDVVARDGVACEVSLVRSEVTIETVARTAGSPDLRNLPTGYSTHEYGGQRWRTYVVRQGDIQIATADSIDVREALMKELMLSAGLPFIVALLGSLVLLWFGITRGLAPLERIRGLLAERRPGDDSPLPNVQAPAELKPLLHTIDQLLARLQAAILRERRFTDNAAHELRTPLTAVKTNIQVARLAAQRPDEAATLDAALAQADEGAHSLQDILQRMLEMARLDAESAGMEHCEPLEAVDAALKALAPLHGKLASRVQVTGGQQAGPVRAAPPLLVAALQNLIDNALRYAPEGTPVEIRFEAQDSNLNISVLDRGPGLDAEARSQAVNRFWRGNSAAPGYGLGLSVVDAIARRFGGTLELRAREDGGLEVRLSLPQEPGAGVRE